MSQLPPYLADDAEALERLALVEVLYTDLDGTMLGRFGQLLSGEEGEPSTAAAEAIVALNRAGLTVVPVSGRTRRQLTELNRLVGWSDAIGEAGGVIVRNAGTREQIVEHNIGSWTPDMVPEGQTPLDVIDAWGAYDALADAFPDRVEWHTPWHLDRETTHLLRGCITVAEGQRVLDDMGAPVDLIDNGLIRPPHELACEQVHALHLVPRGVSKAQSIRLDLAERGLAPHQAMSVGDSAADLGMADVVGLAVMVANALDSPVTRAAIEREPRVRLLHRKRGVGWAELADLWLRAKGHAAD